jgi:hypothetical protein
MEVRARNRFGLPLLLAGAWLVLFAAPSQAAFGLSDVSSAPDDARAGAHSDFRIHVGFQDPQEQVKDLTVHLPPGVSGNPTVPAQCTEAQFNADECPAESLVGEVTAQSAIEVPLLGVPLTPTPADGSIFNLEPQGDEPARFGVQLRPLVGTETVTIHSQAVAQLRPDDFGLDTVMSDLPNQVSGLDVHIHSLDITLFGTANGGPFMGNPTSCAEAVTRFTATSYATPDTPVTAQASFTPTDCASLPFSPTFTATIGGKGQTALAAHPSATTVISQDLGEANLRRAAVRLPSALGASGEVLNSVCPVDAYSAGTCPPGSVIGSARATSPLLPAPLQGPVTLVAPETPGLPRIALDLTGPLTLRLFGQFALLNGGSGAIFDGLPDIPIARFALTFNGGEAGLLVNTQDLCEPPKPTFQTEFLGHSGAERSGNVNAVVKGCGGKRGGGGGDPDATLRLRKATSDHPRLVARIDAGAEELRRVALKLPSELKFAGGRAWRRGAEVSDGEPGRDPSLNHSARRARTRDADGTEKLVLRFGRKALDAAKQIARGDRLRFRINVTDTAGDRTKINERLRARR